MKKSRAYLGLFAGLSPHPHVPGLKGPEQGAKHQKHLQNNASNPTKETLSDKLLTLMGYDSAPIKTFRIDCSRPTTTALRAENKLYEQ